LPPIPNMAAFASTSRATASNKNEVLVEHDDFIADLLRKLKGDGKDWSNVKLEVTNTDDKTYFDRIYVYFGGLKEGFKNGCRRVVALDGCFLKSPDQGEILTAIGRDGNNHIYPIAWAIVNVENKENWSWFLELLGADLDMSTGQDAEHMQCARHIYENFKKQYSGLEFRQLFWATSKASYPRLFNKITEQIKAANPGAYQYLIDKDPKTWSKAFFEVDRGCKAVENGFSECFDSVLVSVSNKPLLTMLEAIIVIVIERMNTIRKISSTWTDDICPSILKRIDLMKNHTWFWHVIHIGGESFEVRSGSDALKVDLSTRACSCRMWQLFGLPCVHVISAIFKINKMPEEYVPNWFMKHLYYATYHNYLSPVGGIDFWPDQSQFSKVLSPKPRVMSGRPKKKRIRVSHEGGSGTRVSKVGGQVTCQNCFQVGHNKKGCKAPSVQKPVMEKKKAGRPRKADAADVGGSASPLGGSANPLGGSANPMGRSAVGVGATGVGRSATSVGRSGVGRSGLGRSGSGVGRSGSDVGVNATGLG
ncbi:multidrug resistance-associated protein 5, partial [Tanacetum coccineum]